jgi:hypothetical protein
MPPKGIPSHAGMYALKHMGQSGMGFAGCGQHGIGGTALAVWIGYPQHWGAMHCRQMAEEVAGMPSINNHCRPTPSHAMPPKAVVHHTQCHQGHAIGGMHCSPWAAMGGILVSIVIAASAI